MKKVKIEIPISNSSTYGKVLDNKNENKISMLWKKVDNIKHTFFGNNEFISLLNGKSDIKDPYTNKNVITISKTNIHDYNFQYDIDSIENKSNISPLKEDIRS